MAIHNVLEAIKPYQNQLLKHNLYKRIDHIDHLKPFLKYHVFAVWDFMSLLKALQKQLTCVELPWIPSGNPETRYLINEIVLAEETDINIDGKRQSHFEMYLDAMESLDVDTSQIRHFLKSLSHTKDVYNTIQNSDLNKALKTFLNFTFEIGFSENAHQIAAAFTFGREDLIPNLFTEILKNFQNNLPNYNLDKLVYYFERHIELDEDEHGPMALKMIEELCGDNEQKWLEVEQVAILALEKRIQLWDAIEEEIISQSQSLVF